MDHVSLVTATTDPIGMPENQYSRYAVALQHAVSNYVSNKFPSEQSAGTVAMKDDKMMVYICAEKPNLRNFWSGKWTSIWTISITDNSTCTIHGDIKVLMSICKYNEYIYTIYAIDSLPLF